MTKQIRYYQSEAKQAVLNALSKGVKKQLLVMPGGTGKTFTAVNTIKDMGRILWITHEESLLEQSAIALLDELELMPKEDLISVINDAGGLIKLLNSSNKGILGEILAENIGVIKADAFYIDKPIVMASAQTLHKRLDLIPKNHFNVIIADEADLFLSKSFRAPLDYFEYDLLLGLTATPFRADGQSLEDMFDELVYEYKIEQAIADGYLTELNAIVVKTSANLDKVHTLGGDFNIKELTEKVNTPERNNLIVNKYIQYCSGQQFICFGTDIQHVIDLHEAFREKGIMTEYVVSDESLITKDKRKSITNGYKSGEIIGLVNYMIYAVGFDHPNTGCVIMACPTKSKRKFLQQLFRVTRLKDSSFVNKFGQIGTILDIVDGTSKHVLINTHELDKELPIENRVFISRANKDKLLAARLEREMAVANIKEDKKVQLYKIPKLRFNFKGRPYEPPSEALLKGIARYGYDIVNNSYSKFQCMEIISSQPAFQEDVNNLMAAGYDVSKGVTRAEVQLAYRQIEARDAKNNAKKYKV